MSIQTATTTQISDMPDYQKSYYKEIMDRASVLGKSDYALPSYNVAGRTPLQNTATSMATQGVGSYQPMLTAGANSVGSGITASQNAMNPLASSITSAGNIGATTAANILNPNAVNAYMNPYETSVVNQTMADIGRQGQVAQNQQQAQAVNQGAFGGSRQAVAQGELNRNTIDAQARAAGQLRQSGYQNAQNQQYQRAVAAGQAGLAGAGMMQSGATAMGNLGLGLGSLGMDQAKLGEAYQGLNLNDINMLNQIGGQEQTQTQTELDATRQNLYQNTMQPYQNLGFYSDIFQGMPTSQSTFTQQQQPGPNAVSQFAGLAGGLYSLGQMNKKGT